LGYGNDWYILNPYLRCYQDILPHTLINNLYNNHKQSNSTTIHHVGQQKQNTELILKLVIFYWILIGSLVLLISLFTGNI